MVESVEFVEEYVLRHRYCDLVFLLYRIYPDQQDFELELALSSECIDCVTDIFSYFNAALNEHYLV